MPRFIPNLTGLTYSSGNDLFLTYRNNYPYNIKFSSVSGQIVSGAVAAVGTLDKNNITGNTNIINGSLFVTGNITVNSGSINVNNSYGLTSIGNSNTVSSTGQNIVVFGQSNFIGGSNVNTFGRLNVTTGDNIVNVGYSNTITGTRILSFGRNNAITTGKDVMVLGWGNTIGYDNTGILVVGDNNNINAFRAYVQGSENMVSGDDSVVFGLRNVLVSGFNNPGNIERSDIFGRNNLVSGGILNNVFGGFNCQYGNLSNLYGNLNTNYASGTLSFGTGNTLSGTATGSMNIGFGIITVLPNVIEIGLTNAGKIRLDNAGNLIVTGNIYIGGSISIGNGNFAGSGDPNGVVVASPGARYLNTGWGINGTGYSGYLVTYYKFSGVNTSFGWV